MQSIIIIINKKNNQWESLLVYRDGHLVAAYGGQ